MLTLFYILPAAVVKSVKVGQHGKNTRHIARDVHSSSFTVLFAVGLPIGFSFNGSVIQLLSLNSDVWLEIVVYLVYCIAAIASSINTIDGVLLNDLNNARYDATANKI